MQFKGINIIPKVSVDNREELSLVYTPGVGSSCLKIKENIDASYIYTNRINSVAVISESYQKALQLEGSGWVPSHLSHLLYETQTLLLTP